jgi:hypothetical protein
MASLVLAGQGGLIWHNQPVDHVMQAPLFAEPSLAELFFLCKCLFGIISAMSPQVAQAMSFPQVLYCLLPVEFPSDIDEVMKFYRSANVQRLLLIDCTAVSS